MKIYRHIFQGMAVALVVAACGFGLTSCGDDDEPNGGAGSEFPSGPVIDDLKWSYPDIVQTQSCSQGEKIRIEVSNLYARLNGKNYVPVSFKVRTPDEQVLPAMTYAPTAMEYYFPLQFSNPFTSLGVKQCVLIAEFNIPDLGRITKEYPFTVTISE